MARPQRGPARPPGLPRWIWVLGASVLTLAITVQPFRDPDVWWHLAIGRKIATSGIPSVEPFSFLTSPHPWVGQQWLYELLLFRAVDWGGAALASVGMGLLATAAFAVAALSIPSARRPSGLYLALPLLLSSLVAGPVLGVRGQVITVLGVSLTLCILARWREGPTTAIWFLPPLLLLWANLHAGFIAGLGIVLIVALAHHPAGDDYHPDRRPLLVALALSAVATLATPAGLALYPYVAQTFANPTLTQNIVEWSSPDFHGVFTRLFEVEMFSLIALWIISGKARSLDVLLGLGAVAAALQAQRNVALFAVVATPQLAVYGSLAWNRFDVSIRRRRTRDARHPRVAAIAVLVVVAVAVASTISAGLTTASTTAFEQTRYPKVPADYVSRHFPGQRLYSTYELGGYLAYRFPKHRVIFIYGESAIFGDENLQRYLDIHLVRGDWEAQLDSLDVHHAILPADSVESGVFPVIGWTVDCIDRESGSVVMSTGANAGSHRIADPKTAPSCS